MHLYTVLALCLLAWAPVVGAQPPSVSWTVVAEDHTLAAPEGHVWLKWAPDADQPVDGYLVERTSPGDAGPIVRQLADTSTFIAGLPEGMTEVRVRALQDGAEGPWSERLHVEVRYPSMGLVRFLGVLGTVLLVATVALILSGHRRDEPPAGPGSVVEEKAEDGG